MATYVDEASATRAVATLNMQNLDSRVVHVRFDRSDEDEAEELVRVFVGGLPWSVDNEALSRHFSSFPPAKLHVMTNMAGRSRGFAILQYRNLAEAEASIEAYDQSEIGHRKIQVDASHFVTSISPYRSPVSFRSRSWPLRPAKNALYVTLCR